MLQLRYGLYSEIQDNLGCDWGASVLQGRESSSSDCTRGVGFVGKGFGATSEKSTGDH